MFGDKQFAQSRTGFRGGESRAATLTFTQLLSSDVLAWQCRRYKVEFRAV